jgi:hypothetical protein
VSSLARVIVLAEDERHQRFIRQYLYRLPAHAAGGRQYEVHDIRPVTAPGGRGSAEQWVRKQYPEEVKEYRKRSAHRKLALLVAIDADTGEVDRRVRQLREALEQAGLAARANGETIVHLIPKRSVETWIVCLSGEQAVELTDYSRRGDVDALIPAAAATLFAWSRPNAMPPANCVPSLSAAIPEVRRLE